MIQPPRILTFPIAEKQRKERIDRYLVTRIPNASRSRIKQLIDAGLVKIDSKPVKPSHLVSPGEVITVHLQPRPGPSFEAEDIPLDIVYEDENLIVINKPSGLVVHPAHGNWSGTLMNALLGHNRRLLELGEGFRAGIVHRLDKDTSGLIVAAKDEFTLSQLGKQFREKTVQRKYIALAWGRMKKERGIVEENLARSHRDRKIFTVSREGKSAVTEFQALKRFDLFTLLELTLRTGRTHQIRVHLAHLGHPVFGDSTYGGRNARFGNLTHPERIRCARYLEIMPRQALHAKTLGFLHPHKKTEMFFDSQLPDDFTNLLTELENDLARSNENHQ